MKIRLPPTGRPSASDECASAKPSYKTSRLWVGPRTPEIYDVAVVGSGPAGLAASVYAASQGLKVLLLEKADEGGKIRTAASFDNLPGFPTGICGSAMVACAAAKAQRLGVHQLISAEVTELRTRTPTEHLITLANGVIFCSRSVVIATGARYRELNVPGVSAIKNGSIHYWASAAEAQLAAGEEIAVVGGGETAGLAIEFLAHYASHLLLFVHRTLDSSMSSWLADRIRTRANVTLFEQCEITELEGYDQKVSGLHWCSRGHKTIGRVPVSQLFVFLGAKPNTEWLLGSGVMLDARGFILTETEQGDGSFALETSQPGVFAIGDVRAGSVKRVMASAQEGVSVVASLRSYLTTRPSSRMQTHWG